MKTSYLNLDQPTLPSVDICGVRVSAVNLSLACEIIEGWIKAQHKTYVCVAPVSMIVDSHSQEGYKAIVNQAGMVTPDGMPLVWLAKSRGHKAVARTYGPDIMLRLCEISAKKGYKHYFYGGRPEVCEQLETKLKKRFPGLSIAGRFSPPFSSDYHCEEEILTKINQANPDILWVALGSPKQDFWMAEYRGRLNVPVIVGVGAAFDFLSGAKKQAPLWMRKCGLEWFFRLCCEPKRLWKRYLIGNTKFIYYLLKDFLRSKTKMDIVL